MEKWKLAFYIYTNQTSVPRIRMGRISWMARTDLKVPSSFHIFLSKKKPLSLEHRYLEQLNSINGPVNNKITSFSMPNSNLTDRCMLRLNVLILLQGVINVRLLTDNCLLNNLQAEG